jgi:transcriptional regulator with XRE-family HTH domain
MEVNSILKSEVFMVMGAKWARIVAGFTLQAVSKELHVSVATLWRWEAGQQAPSIEKVKELAELYGCSERRLMKSPKPTRCEARKSEAEFIERAEHAGAAPEETQNE